MSKVGILVALSLVFVLAIWAVNRDTGPDPVQRPDSTSRPSESNDGSVSPSLVPGETQDEKATAAPADDDDTESRDHATREELVFALDSNDVSIPTSDRIENEPVDTRWAPQMESVLWSTTSTIGEVLEVKCRTTICRAVVVPSASESWALGQNRILNDSFQSIIGNSDGRLDRVRVGIFGAADGRPGMTIDVLGPPLETAATDSP